MALEKLDLKERQLISDSILWKLTQVILTKTNTPRNKTQKFQ